MPAKKKTAKKTVKRKAVNGAEKPVVEIIAEGLRKPKRMTAGFYIMLAYLGVSIFHFLTNLIFGSITHPDILFGYVYTPFAGLIITSVSALVWIILGYGIIKRINWTRKLSFIWYFIMSLSAIVSIISYLANSSKFTEYFRISISAIPVPEGMTMAEMIGRAGGWFVFVSILEILVFAIILLFYYRKKDYFNA